MERGYITYLLLWTFVEVEVLDSYLGNYDLPNKCFSENFAHSEYAFFDVPHINKIISAEYEESNSSIPSKSRLPQLVWAWTTEA